MESFNETLLKVRYDDYKKALSEQIQIIFGDNSSTLFESGMERMQDLSQCPAKDECLSRLTEMRKDTLAAFQREDIGSSLTILEETEGGFVGKHSPCKDKKCSRATIEMIHEIKVLFSISDNFMFRNYIQPETGFTRLSSQGRFFTDHRRTKESELPSEDIARLLGPLSNPFRIEALKMLSIGEKSFTEISRGLDLQTGHLQFHLKVLTEVGYIRNNKRRRTYSITEKGLTALDGLQRFYSGLSVISSGFRSRS